MTSPLHRATVALVAASAAAACLGCAPGPAAHRAATDAPPATLATLATVTNDDLADVRLYVLTEAGARWPLGYLRAGATGTLRFPRGILLPSDVQILGAPVGRGAPRATPPTTVFPGDRLVVTLRAPELLSTLLKRR